MRSEQCKAQWDYFGQYAIILLIWPKTVFSYFVAIYVVYIMPNEKNNNPTTHI